MVIPLSWLPLTFTLVAPTWCRDGQHLPANAKSFFFAQKRLDHSKRNCRHDENWINSGLRAARNGRNSAKLDWAQMQANTPPKERHPKKTTRSRSTNPFQSR